MHPLREPLVVWCGVVECTDRTPQEVTATIDKKQYQCAPCPSGMEGNGESCAGTSHRLCQFDTQPELFCWPIHCPVSCSLWVV